MPVGESPLDDLLRDTGAAKQIIELTVQVVALPPRHGGQTVGDGERIRVPGEGGIVADRRQRAERRFGVDRRGQIDPEGETRMLIEVFSSFLTALT